MTQSRDVACECAIAFGRSEQWMLAHGYTRDDIRRAVKRMDAADRDDNAAWVAALSHDDPIHPYDETIVEAVLAGTVTVSRHRCPAELVEAIRRLAGQGLSDPDIGKRVGRSKDATTAIRKRNSIAAGVPRTGTTGEMSWSRIWKPNTRDRRPSAEDRAPKSAEPSSARAIIEGPIEDGPGTAANGVLRGLTPTGRG